MFARERIEADLKRAKAGKGVLSGYYPPSTAKLSELYSATLGDLHPDCLHKNVAIYLIIKSVSISNGMNMMVQDAKGREGRLWSMIEYPCPGGKAAMSEGTIVAVKEPYFGVAPDGGHVYHQFAVCVYAPSDITRISKFSLAVAELFPSIAVITQTDHSKAGNALLSNGKPMEAADMYTQGIRVIGRRNASEATIKEMTALYLKRAFASIRVRLYASAVMDLAKVLVVEPTNQNALRLACNATLEVGKYQAAQCYAAGLMAIAPNDEANQRVHVRVSRRLQQALGNYDLGSIAKATTPEDVIKDASTFVGDIEIRKSALHGRGMFAKKRLATGQLLLCEKPLAVCYDTTRTSFKEFSQRLMAFIQELASSAVADPTRAKKLFTLFDGKGNEAPASVNGTIPYNT